MKVTFLKKCMIMSGVQKIGSSLEVNDVFAQMHLSLGVAKEHTEKKQVVEQTGRSGQRKTENKALKPKETK